MRKVEKTNKVIRENVRVLMAVQDLSYPALAKALKIDRSYLSILLSGKRNFQMHLLESLAKKFKVQPSWLTSKHDFMRAPFQK